jgi:predicted acyl esterase
LPDYAKVFAAAGFVALTFDYRGFGGSQGTKWRLIPLEQIDDIRNAITFLQGTQGVDPERIGVWGTSFGGGHAPYVAGIDSRVKAAVGQVGFGDGERLVLDSRGYAESSALQQKLREDQQRRVREGVGETTDAIAILNADQTRAFLEPLLKEHPLCSCDLSWETVEKTLEYKPINVVDKISPRPLLLIGARMMIPARSRAIESYTNVLASRRNSLSYPSHTMRSTLANGLKNPRVSRASGLCGF